MANGGRIGKVRMKATGFEFRVIPGANDPETDFGARMLKCAREIGSDPGLVGYVVVGLTDEGSYRCGFRWDESFDVDNVITYIKHNSAPGVNRDALLLLPHVVGGRGWNRPKRLRWTPPDHVW